MAKINVCGYEGKITSMNKTTGLRRIEVTKELLDRIRDFSIDVLKETDFSVNNIRGFKSKGNTFSFTCGGGYNIVNADLLNAGNTGERSRVFEDYCKYCKEPTKNNLEILNKQIEVHNNSKFSDGQKTEKINIEKFNGYEKLEKEFENNEKKNTVKKAKSKEGNER